MSAPRLLRLALEEARFGLQLTARITREELEAGTPARRGLERVGSVLGGAVRRALQDDPGLKARFPEIDWSGAVRLGALADAAPPPSDAELFDAVTAVCPALARTLEAALGEIEA